MQAHQTDKGQQPPQDDAANNGAQKSNPATQQLRILSRFIIKEKLGSGSFGHIYKAFDQERNEFVALKIESHAHSNNLTLNREAKILNELEGGSGLPTIYYYSKEDNYSLLAMTLLGSNLEKLFKSCSRKFSLRTVLMLADQMVRKIEYIHSKGYLHRDIKPENFVMGTQKDPKTLFIIDFGLSKMYRDHSGKHNAYKEGRGLVGTARYASISTHLGIEQSRRDDLESIGYLLIYFLKGILPWQNIKSQTKTEKYKLIAECKMNTPIEELCKDVPKEFTTYMNYVRNLTFTDQPDYKYLKKIFRQLLVESGYRFDFDYDWCRISEKGILEYEPPREQKNTDKKDEKEGLGKIERKELEIYEEIKNKALEYNLEFREKNRTLAFGPPQNPAKGNANGLSPSGGHQRERALVSPVRKPAGQTQTFTSTVLGKMNPKVESDYQIPNSGLRKNDFKPSQTLTCIKSSGMESPVLLSRNLHQANARRAGRKIMPEKPSFTQVNVVVLAEGDHSSPQLSVNEGSSTDFREGQKDMNQKQEEKNPFDEAARRTPKNNSNKRAIEVKSKTVAATLLKGGGQTYNAIENSSAVIHKTGKMLSTNNMNMKTTPQPNTVNFWKMEAKGVQ